jgi:hypothetical protein
MKKNRSKPRVPAQYYRADPHNIPHNPVGDADVYIKGLSQPLHFKEISCVFPEKVRCDLELSVTMVTQNTTIIVEAKDDSDSVPRAFANVYSTTPAVRSITWSKPHKLFYVHHGVFYPHDPTWTITMPYDTYGFQTLEEGNYSVYENEYHPYGGHCQQQNNMDKTFDVSARFLLNSEEIEITEGAENFGLSVLRGGIILQFSKTQNSILTFGAYKAAVQAGQNSGFSAAEQYVQKYRSVDYGMLGKSTMRVHFERQNA